MTGQTAGSPDGALVQAADGSLYSTTRFGGANNAGTVFKITPGGTLTTFYSFCSQSGCTDGADPTGALIQATDGNFYGTTQSGGVNNDGTVFTITPSGALTVLHSFGGTDGATPWGAPLVQDTHGEFYGTTSGGGTYGYGTVFSLSVGLGPFVETLPTSGNVGVAVEILGTNLTGATSVSFNGTAATFEVASNSEITTTVPTGATTGYVTVTTPSGTLTSNVVFRVGTGTLVPTTTTLTSSPNPSNYGQAVTLTATVTSSAGAPPNGEAVSFMNGTTPLKTGTLSGGSASITISTLPVGTDAITAVYAGDPNFRGSTSNTVSQVVLGIAASTPTFSPTPGTYSTPQSVTLADASPGVTIYYTTNGSTPTTASTPYSGAIKVSTTTTIEAIAAGNGYAPSPVAVGVYTITSSAAMPIFSPFPSNYTAPETVSLSDMSSGVTIYYTLDGSTPSATNGTAYTAPIKLIATTTIKAIATGGSYGSSAVNSGTYTLQAATPSFSPMPSTYAPPKTVTLSDFTPGVTIYYTLDGSTPSSTNGRLYTGPIMLTNSTTIKAIAVGAGISPSAIASGTFTLQAMTPSFSPMPSTYATPKTVTLYDATSGVTVYYTLDGSTPSSTNGSVYTGPITLTKSTTIQAIAIGTGISPSAVASGTYTLQAMTPGFTPMPSSYTRQVNVTLYDATSSATIYYTTDGSTPSASNGTPYAGPMTVTTTTTIKAVAIGTGYNPSAVATGTYTINP